MKEDTIENKCSDDWFLTLHGKNNIRTYSVTINDICTRSETGHTTSPMTRFFPPSIGRKIFYNFIFSNNMHILYLYN